MRQKTIFIKIRLLSPLHLGCGEDYEPTGFVIDPESDELASFSPLQFISRLEAGEKEEFSRICARGDIGSLLEIYRFMRKHAGKVDGHRVAISPGLKAHYEETLKLSSRKRREIQQKLNQFRIERTAFQPFDNLPYIPGTAVKGALRTALLNRRKPAHRLPVDRGTRAGQKLEKKILRVRGDFAADPLRLVKISDFFPVGTPRTRIVYAVNRKKKPSKYEASAPYQIVETVAPESEFIGTVTLFTPDQPEKDVVAREQETAGRRGKKSRLELPAIPVTAEELRRTVTAFYRKENQRENLQLKNIGLSGVELPGGEELLPLRLGRHSGAECLTIEGYRNIRIKGKGRDFSFKPEATTLWLAADHKKPAAAETLRPFGWAAAEILEPESWRKLQREAEGQRRRREEALVESARQRQREEAELKVRQRRAAAEKAREEAKQAAAEEARQQLRKRWEALEDNDKYLEILRQTELARACASGIDIMSRIWPQVTDDATPSDQRRSLAEAFKDYFQKEDKWKVSKKKKKQYEKVQTIKRILGEG